MLTTRVMARLIEDMVGVRGLDCEEARALREDARRARWRGGRDSELCGRWAVCGESCVPVLGVLHGRIVWTLVSDVISSGSTSCSGLPYQVTHPSHSLGTRPFHRVLVSTRPFDRFRPPAKPVFIRRLAQCALPYSTSDTGPPTERRWYVIGADSSLLSTGLLLTCAGGRGLGRNVRRARLRNSAGVACAAQLECVWSGATFGCHIDVVRSSVLRRQSSQP